MHVFRKVLSYKCFTIFINLIVSTDLNGQEKNEKEERKKEIKSLNICFWLRVQLETNLHNCK